MVWQKYIDLTPESAITAAGNSSAAATEGSYTHTVQVVADYEDAGDDNVTVLLQGSVDGTNYGTLPLKNTNVAGLTITANLALIETPGNYILQTEAKVPYLRLRVSAVSATTAGISADYFGGRA